MKDFSATRALYSRRTAILPQRTIIRPSLRNTAPRCIRRRTSSTVTEKLPANSSASSSGTRPKCWPISIPFLDRAETERLLVAQGVDRVELGGLHGGKPAADHADD